jgi:hypothetical protein
MAPFVSRRQAGLSDQWQEIGERLMGGDAAAAQAVLQGVEELQGQGSVQEFLIAQAKLLLKEEDYAQFILAKDLDLVPFRARQGVVAQLRQALQGLEGVHWVPTSQGILERFGLRGFSNLLSSTIYILTTVVNRLWRRSSARLCSKRSSLMPSGRMLSGIFLLAQSLWMKPPSS